MNLRNFENRTYSTFDIDGHNEFIKKFDNNDPNLLDAKFYTPEELLNFNFKKNKFMTTVFNQTQNVRNLLQEEESLGLERK